MADKVIGLDVGTSAVRAVSLARGQPSRLEQHGQIELPAGVVIEGEVVDVAAASSALRQLWKDVGFKSRSVRVAIASPRVIVRTVDMPMLSEGDTRAALQLQLGDYIPMAPEATVFDFQTFDDPGDEGSEHQLLLAAAPREAVRPLVEAVRQAGLRVEHVDVAASALARLVRPGPDGRPGGGCDAVVSIGAGTIVVTAAGGGGDPIFSRTITNVSGRHVTDHIATELAIHPTEAERLKRHVPDHESTDVAARVLLATDPFVTEICEEIGDSLDYFARLPGGRPVRSVAITGGGSLLAGVRERLERRLRVPVRLLKPFDGVAIAAPAIPPAELATASPFLGLAAGTALGAERTRVRQINLLPDTVRGATSSRTRLLVGGVAAVVLVGAGALYLHQGNVLAEAKAQRADVEAELSSARAVAAERAAANQPATDSSPAAAVWRYAQPVDIAWAEVNAQLGAVSEPLGVGITAVAAAVTDAASTTATTAPAASASTTGAGSIGVTGTAADLDVIAAWIDAVVANEHFEDAWVGSVTKTPDAGGLTFTATVVIGDGNLVARPQLDEVRP